MCIICFGGLVLKSIIVYFYLYVFSFTLFTQNTISILYFENTRDNKDYSWLSKGLTDMLITDISKVDNVQVIEREDLQKILSEQTLSLSGLTDDSRPIEVGKLLNATTIIYGSFIIMDKKIRVDAKISDVETGKIISTFSTTGELMDIFTFENDLSTKIFNHLSIKQNSKSQNNETESIEALKHYYEGVELFDDGAVDEALQKFTTARTLDPFYIKPQQGLESSYKFLKDFKKIRHQREVIKLNNKINQLTKRLSGETWLTYADLIQQTNFMSKTTEQQQKFNEDNHIYLICNTPAQCTWQLMITIDELARKYNDTFNDPETQNKLWRKNIEIANSGEESFKNDPFVPEIIYWKIMTLYFLRDFKQVKNESENFLIDYPDYRMIETIEDYYQNALDEIAKQN